MRSVVFFGSRGVGKTTLVYHLASMLADLGETVLAVDLDPNPDLTTMFLTEAVLESFWNVEPPHTVCSVSAVHRFRASVETMPGLTLLVGDPGIAALDETAARQLVERVTALSEFAWMLIDLGPDLGPLNRAAVTAADQIVVPLRPDLVCSRSLRTYGAAFHEWVSSGAPASVGYVVMQHAISKARRPNADQLWINRFPELFRTSVLGEERSSPTSVEDDPHCLGSLKHYRSLMPMALDARKPVFALKPADGAIGAYAEAVSKARSEFQRLVDRIAAMPSRAVAPR